jgi:uncharacterized protein (DUF488 family)
MVIYTIGHSTHTWEDFLRLLATHNIEVVADVRSKPYSRFNPQFNRDALANGLEEAGKRYLFLGKELGGKPQDPDRPLADELVWEYIRSRPQFKEGLARLLEEARQANVCLLCAEADPGRCHRGQLLAPELEGQGVEVRHVLGNGSLLEQSDVKMPAKKPGQKRLF